MTRGLGVRLIGLHAILLGLFSLKRMCESIEDIHVDIGMNAELRFNTV